MCFFVLSPARSRELLVYELIALIAAFYVNSNKLFTPFAALSRPRFNLILIYDLACLRLALYSGQRQCMEIQKFRTHRKGYPNNSVATSRESQKFPKTRRCIKVYDELSLSLSAGKPGYAVNRLDEDALFPTAVSLPGIK